MIPKRALFWRLTIPKEKSCSRTCKLSQTIQNGYGKLDSSVCARRFWRLLSTAPQTSSHDDCAICKARGIFRRTDPQGQGFPDPQATGSQQDVESSISFGRVRNGLLDLLRRH